MSEPHPTPSVKLTRNRSGEVAVELSSGAITSNRLEIQAALQMQDAGYEVIRNGWPDFLAIKGDEVVFVEVKPANRKELFSEAQQTVLSALKKMGLNVKVMVPESLPPTPTTDPEIQRAVDALSSCRVIGILPEFVFPKKTWLAEFIRALPPERILVVPDTRSWNGSNEAKTAAVQRGFRIDVRKPRGKITSKDQWEMEAFASVVNKAQGVMVATEGSHSPSMWAIKVAAARLRPLVVLDRIGNVVRLKKDGS